MTHHLRLSLILTALISCALLPLSTGYLGLVLPPFDPRIDSQVLEIMAEAHAPSSAVAVVRNNTVIWSRGYGEQPDPSMIYGTGSVTKSITGTAIFQLIERGFLQLDDDVNEYLPFSLRHPNFTETPITIRMLLLHTSGLSKMAGQAEWGLAQDIVDRIGMVNPYDWLPYPLWIEEHLTPGGSLYNASAWIESQPGTVRHYSNVGYEVLAYIIHLASGQPVWEYVHENIFGPLGMMSSGYNLTDFDISRLVIPYLYNETTDENIAYPHYNNLAYGAGAIRSNAYDLAKFLMVHMHRGVSNGVRILEEQTITLMHQIDASYLTGSSELINWDGWGGTEGDGYGYHCKAYEIHDGNTTVPYAIITFLNQHLDVGRDAAYNITRLLQRYVHKYDVLDEIPEPDLPLLAAVSGVVIIVVLVAVKKFYRS